MAPAIVPLLISRGVAGVAVPSPTRLLAASTDNVVPSTENALAAVPEKASVLSD